MLQMTAAIGDESSSDASDLGDLLSEEEFRAAKAEALKTVTVPKSVVDTIADLRQFLQEKVEPPVYVSGEAICLP